MWSSRCGGGCYLRNVRGGEGWGGLDMAWQWCGGGIILYINIIHTSSIDVEIGDGV